MNWSHLTFLWLTESTTGHYISCPFRLVLLVLISTLYQHAHTCSVVSECLPQARNSHRGSNIPRDWVLRIEIVRCDYEGVICLGYKTRYTLRRAYDMMDYCRSPLNRPRR